MARRPSAHDVCAAIEVLADPDRAADSARFFQAFPGGYGEGDEFLGVTVPRLRAAAKGFRGIGRDAVTELLGSRFHEIRLTALFLMRAEFDRADEAAAQAWVGDYVAAVHAGQVNNWDLVDSSADPILGEWQYRSADVGPLREFAKTPALWHRRVGVIGTFAFIKHGDADALLSVAPLVIADHRPLIQKAFGWMLREMGKRIDEGLLTGYLDNHAAQMGRTALGYAVERLDPEQRKHFRSLR
ncbi:DNA alkylation repair protein [Gordonia sp. NPDC003425]